MQMSDMIAWGLIVSKFGAKSIAPTGLVVMLKGYNIKLSLTPNLYTMNPTDMKLTVAIQLSFQITLIGANESNISMVTI